MKICTVYRYKHTIARKRHHWEIAKCQSPLPLNYHFNGKNQRNNICTQCHLLNLFTQTNFRRINNYGYLSTTIEWVTPTPPTMAFDKLLCCTVGFSEQSYQFTFYWIVSPQLSYFRLICDWTKNLNVTRAGVSPMVECYKARLQVITDIVKQLKRVCQIERQNKPSMRF